MKENLFIRNPYLAMVLAIVITLCGILALLNMPAAQYPNVTPPQVSVSLNYPGADAMTLLKSAVIPLEQQINSAPQLLYLDSTSSDTGSAVITATFAVGTDPERNVQNVQDRVNWGTPSLPEAVRSEGIQVRQKSSNILLGIALKSPRGTYDTLFMSNYGSIHLKERIERIPGVAQVMMFGGADYAMRVWIDTEKCASLGLAVNDITDALQSQNVQVSAGSAGAAPAPPGNRFTLTIHTRGRLADPEEFGEIIVRSRNHGGQVRLRDVAHVELAAESYTSSCRLNTTPAVILLVFQRSGANALAIADQCRQVMSELAKDFPPDLAYSVQYDTTEAVRIGIRDVVRTLLLAVLLVTLVTFLFLQDWRMALVPALAIPVSVVGTFTILKLTGMSINMVTLFALTLAIGIVVDDAIIVTENVSRLMEEEKLQPREAAEKSMKQITGAIVATTAVLLAMFVPVCFFPGITGELYRQFGVTISIAVLLSACNALTLSPALCSILLKSRERPWNGLPFRIFNRGFAYVAEAFRSLESVLMKAPLATAATLLAAGLAVGFWYTKQPGGFIPEEDQGYFFVAVRLPSGSSLASTARVAEEVCALLRKIPGVADTIAIPGYSVLNSLTGTAEAFVIAQLKPWDERTSPELAERSLVKIAQYELYTRITGALNLAFAAPAIPGIGTAGGFNFVLEEREALDSERLGAVLQNFLLEANQAPELGDVFSPFTADSPVIRLRIDREKALKLGVSIQRIDTLLESTFGYRYLNDFNRFGQIYKVELQALPRNRARGRDLLNLHVLNASGQNVPLASLARISESSGASFLSRHNLRLCANIMGSPRPGFSSGEAMARLEKMGGALPRDMTWTWTDMSYQEAAAGRSGPWILALALTFIFLFLAALYASWALPLAVMPAIIPAWAGALALLSWTGANINLYTQIGIVLLFGMACKTAILVIDFARREHAAGKSAQEAARDAARMRFRAVMMTALAFIFGTMPLIFASGPSAGSQHAIGVPVVGGMVGSIFAGLLFAPVFFALIRGALDRRKQKTPGRRSTLFTLLATGCAAVLAGCYTPPPAASIIEARSLREIPPSPAARSAKLRKLAVLTPADALEIALANNPTYQAAFSSIEAAKLRYYQALGAYSPKLSAATSVGRQFFGGNDGSLYFSGQDESFYSFTTVQANWILFDGLSREFALLATRRERRREELLSLNAKRVLERGVRQAYDDVLLAQEQIRIAAANVSFQDEQLRQTERKQQLGDAQESSVLHFRSQTNRARMDLVKARNHFAVARFALLLLMGCSEAEPSATLRFEELRDNAPEPLLFDADYYLNEALANRPDLNAIRENLQALKYRFYRYYGAYMPVISAFAGYSYSTANIQYSGNNPSQYGTFYQNGSYFNYGGMAAIDVFDGFIRYNRLRAARAELDRSYFQAAESWLKTVNEVRAGHTDCRYAAELLKLARSTRDAMKRERDIVTREYALGAADILRLNEAQDQFVRSSGELAAARIALRKAFVRLRAAAAMPMR